MQIFHTLPRLASVHTYTEEMFRESQITTYLQSFKCARGNEQNGAFIKVWDNIINCFYFIWVKALVCIHSLIVLNKMRERERER